MNDETLTGRQLGNFKLERILGRGGMGQVYYGRDIKLNRPVAVKVIDARFRSNPAYAERFAREAQAVATWRHENIAQVYYADEQDGLYFFAMEYINGQDLGQVLLHYATDDETMPRPDILRIGRAVASAIDYAHSKDVIHRDVKPSNVIVANDGRVVLTDFGLALDMHQGSVGEVFGSAHYIAPEQARRSSEATPQSDIYSLGVMLFEMLTGVVPFDDPSPTSVALLHIMQPPPAPRTINPKLNNETENVLLKALSKLPQDRYQSGQALIEALENAFKQGEVPTTPLPPLPVGMHATGQRPNAAAATPTEAAPPRPPSVEKTPSVPVAKPSAPVVFPTPAAPVKDQNRPLVLIAFGGCLLSVVGLMVFIFILLRPLLTLMQTPVFGNTQTPSSGATAAIPTDAAQISETATVSGESPTSTQPVSATATVLYPNGKHFTILYNDNSFYFLNSSQSNIPINWVAFERLSNADTPINRFNGALWAKYYPTILAGRCMALEILDSSPYLSPSECGHKNFLSLRTPVSTEDTIFWTTQDGSHQFRVLWREGSADQEVARCEISAGKCEVFFP